MEVKQGNSQMDVSTMRPPEDEPLIKLARARVAARQKLRWHIMLYILAGVLGVCFLHEIKPLLFFSGGMLVEGAHVFIHIMKYVGRPKYAGIRKDPVEAEYRKLKLMATELKGFTD